MKLARKLIAPLLDRWHERQARRARKTLMARCRLASAAGQDLPPSVRTAWAMQSEPEFPGMPTDAFAWELASTALAQFFEVCLLHGDGKPCGLPSLAADAIWHAALAHARPEFEDWQRRHFGRVLPHRENAELGVPPEEALARTWVLACRGEGRDPSTTEMPLVFAVDGRLRMPGGWAYDYNLKSRRVQHRLIDARGELAPMPRPHDAMTMTALGAAGLLTAAELAGFHATQEAWLRAGGPPRRKQEDGSGSSCGGGCGSSWSDPDGCSADGGGCSSDGGGGGDAGGSSCGSSCGGGCGGGCGS